MSGSLSRFTTDYRVKSGPHPWSVPYSPECIMRGCKNKPLCRDNIHYSCCDDCLKQKKLGPYKKRFTKADHYSTLFWLSDWEKEHEIERRKLN